MLRKAEVLMILPLLLGLTQSLSTTLVLYDADSGNSSIQDCVNILRDDMTVQTYEVEPSKTLEVIRENICTKLAETKDLKIIVDYSRVPAVNTLLDAISQQLRVPHLRMNSAVLPEFGSHNFQLQMYPGTVLQLLVLKDFLRQENMKGGWDKAFVILPSKSSDLKNFANLAQNVDQPLIIRKWTDSLDDNNRMLNEAPNSEVRHFIVALEPRYLNEFFALASSKRMLGFTYSYLLTHPEATTVDLTAFAYSGATIIAVTADTGASEAPLMVKLTNIVKHLAQPLKSLSAWNPRCSGLPWADGQKAMKAVMSQASQKSELLNPHEDLSVPSLDYQYNLMSLTTTGYGRISYWRSNRGFRDLTRQLRSVEKRQAGGGDPIKVITLQSKPFVIYRKKDEKGKELTGNDQFTGLGIEVFKKVADKLNLKYTISLAKEEKYGALLKDNTWSGMIGEIKRAEADVAVGDLTITSERSNVVDFSSPYINLGITIMMKTSTALTSTIDFCAAFAPEVWVLVIFSLILASLALFVAARLSPYEWYNSDETTKVNYFTLADCFWFITGASLFRGTNLMPRAIGTRLVSLVWWLFILLLVVAYAVSLQEFIPKAERMLAPIRSMKDLSKQTKVKYGAINSGSTFGLFKRSTNPMYKRMYEFMVTNPDAMVNSTLQGVERVKNSSGDYAFILESTSAEYYTARNCDLKQVGDVVHPRSFGFALQKGSKLTSKISKTMLAYQEDGTLERIKEYWLYSYRISTPCSEQEDDSLEPLNAYLLTRLFVGLILGLIIALIVCVIELVVRALRPQERGDKTVAGYLIGRVRLVFCLFSGQDKEGARGEEDEAAAQPALSSDGAVTDKDAEKA